MRNDDLISRSGLGVDFCNPDVFENKAYAEGWNSLIKIIKEAPAVDAVSPGVAEQFRWERDIAIAQLQELGIGLGQKKPDMVEVVRCDECIFAQNFRSAYVDCKCWRASVPRDGFCFNGARKMDAEVE